MKPTGMLPAGIIALFLSWLQLRCQDKKRARKDSGHSVPEKNEPQGSRFSTFERKTEAGTKKETAGGHDKQGPSSSGSSYGRGCQEDGSSVLPEKISEAGEDFQVSLKLYGRENSSLLVLELPSYQKNELTDVFIADRAGRLVAQRGISEVSDLREDGFLKSMVFDHLRISTGSSLIILFKTLEGLFLKKTLNRPVFFETKFRGLPVRGPGLPGFHDPDYYDRHPGNTFSPDAGLFRYQKKESDLLQAGYNTDFLFRDDLAGTVITDLMGNTLAEHGEHFNQIKEDTMFIVYRLMGRKYWFRTFVRVS